jgi:ferredoxin
VDLESLRDLVQDFLARDPANTLAMDTGEPAWDDFLLGVSRGDDPLYPRIRAHIGDFHWTPAQAFALAFPDRPAEPAELAVITWILPQREAVRQDQRRAGPMPSERWSRVRHFGEAANKALRGHVAATLMARGVPAVAPWDSPLWGRHVSPDYSFASSWSERHAAFVAGLGTFGLSDGLITPRGKAVRVGSVVARVPADALPATPRPYGDDHRAWCLFFSTGTCLKCAERCPAGAIGPQGHDKERCRAYIRGTTAPFVERDQLGVRVNSCGLCQCGVPCEARIPASGRPRKD